MGLPNQVLQAHKGCALDYDAMLSFFVKIRCGEITPQQFVDEFFPGAWVSPWTVKATWCLTLQGALISSRPPALLALFNP